MLKDSSDHLTINRTQPQRHHGLVPIRGHNVAELAVGDVPRAELMEYQVSSVKPVGFLVRYVESRIR